MCAQMNYAHDMAKETTINLRVDQETKDKAAEIFARCGFTTSNAIRLFLLRAIKEDDWPFDIHVSHDNMTPEEFQASLGEVTPIDDWDLYIKNLQDEVDAEIKAERKVKRNAKRNAKS